jgi:hypothetical protein
LNLPEVSGAVGPTESRDEELSKEKTAVECQSEAEPAQIVPLPQPEIEQLLALAERGSVKKILAALNDIEHLDEKYTPFINKLRKLAKSFQIDEIVELLETEDET